jgi:outer membrane protein assembly factor BamB
MVLMFLRLMMPPGVVARVPDRPVLDSYELRDGKSLVHVGPCRGEAPAFSPDGQFVAIRQPTGIRVWNAQTGRLCAEARFPWKKKKWTFSYSVAFAWGADGKQLYCKHHQSLLKVDARKGKYQSGHPTLVGADSFGLRLALSPNGRWLATGGGGVLHVYDARTGELAFRDPMPPPLLGVMNARYAHIPDLAFDPDSGLLAECYANENITQWTVDHAPVRLWDVRRQILVRQCRVDGRPWSVSFSPDGRLLAVTTWRGKTLLLETETGKEVCNLSAPGWFALSATFSADGQFVLGGGFRGRPEDRRISVWRLASGRQVAQWSGYYPAVSADGRWVASVDDRRWTVIWDAGFVFRSTDEPLNAAELERLWQALASDNRGAAYRAAWRLARCPERAAPFLRRRLLALDLPDGARVTDLVRQLDSADFGDREKASLALERMGPRAALFLRGALAERPSLEVHRRIERILARSETTYLPPEWPRADLALMSLELAGTPAAREALAELARKGSTASLRSTARAALARLDRRGKAVAASPARP